MAALSSQFAQISPGMNLDTATDGLVSTMKAFHIEVDEAESKIMDLINVTGNTMATTNEEVVEMLTRSSAAMSAANNTLQETIALESAAVQITRNAETTGTAFRTISMRIRGYDEETEELSDDLKNISGDIADLTKTAKHAQGISLFTDETKETYKSTYQILKEISEIWDELTDKQQAQLLEKLGGKRGAQTIAGILADFSEVEKAMTNMSNAAGSADREMGIIEQSIDYKINRLKQTWVGLVQDLIDKGTLGKLVDALTTISEAIAHIVTHGWELLTVVTAITAVKVFKNREVIISFFTSVLDSLARMVTVSPVVVAAETAETVAVEAQTAALEANTVATEQNIAAKRAAAAAALGEAGSEVAEAGAEATKATGLVAKLSAAFKGLAAALGVSAGVLGGTLAGVTLVLGGAAVAAYEAKKANEELRKSANELGSSMSDTTKSIGEYKQKLSSLHEKLQDENLSYEESKSIREQLLTVQDELISQYGTEASAINSITSAVDGEINALDRLSAIQWQQTKNNFNNQNLKGWDSLNRATHGAKDNIDLMLKEMDDVEISFIVNNEDREFAQTMADLYGGKLGWNDELGSGALILSGNLETVQNQLLSIQTTAENLGKDLTFSDSLNKSIKDNQEVLTAYQDMYDQYVLYERILGTTLESNYKNYSSALAEYKQAVIDDNKELQDASFKAMQDEYQALFEDFSMSGDGIDAAEQSILDFFANLSPEITLKINQDSLKNQLSEVFDEVTGDTYQDKLNEAISKFSSTEQLFYFNPDSDSAPESLIQSYELIESVAQSAGMSVKELYEYLEQLGVLETELSSNHNKTTAKNYLNDWYGGEGRRASVQDVEHLAGAFEELNKDQQDTLSLFGDSEWEAYRNKLKELYSTTDTTTLSEKQLKDALIPLIEEFERVKSAADDSSEGLDAWNSYLDKTLEKIGMAKEDFEDYVKTLQEMNPELAGNQEEAEKCALANQLFSNAVDDLQSNWEKYKEDLSDVTRKTPEFNEAIEKMADNLTYLTGMEFSVTDAAEFLKDEKNLNNLEKAINGDDAALQQLQADAAEGVYIEVDEAELNRIAQEMERLVSSSGVEIPAGIDTSNFNAELNSLIDWMNGTNLGELSATAIINENPFMQALADIIAQGGNAANQLISMFDSLGWDVSWDYTKTNLQLPRVTTQNQVMKGQSAYQYAKSQYDKKGNGWAASAPQFTGYKVTGYDNVPITSPDNIRFIRKGKGGGRKATPQKPYVPSSIKAPSNTNKPGGGGGGGGGGGSNPSDNSANEQEDKYDEVFDYFERRLEVLNNAAELLDKNLENVVGSMAKNTLLDAKSGIYKEQMNNYEDALNMYQQKADEAFSKLPADIQARIKDGAVAITEFIGEGNEELVTTINEYKDWADKVDDVKQNLAELKETLRQLELEKFNNIVQDFTEQFDLRQSAGIDLIKQQIELLEEAGQVIGEGFYTAQINQTQKQLNILNQEKDALVKQMQTALANGVDKGSEEWLEMVNTLSDVEGKILDCKTAVEEFDNAILQLHVDMFNRVQDSFSNFNDELSDLKSLIESQGNDVATKDNNWTSDGIAQLGLLAQQYEMASYQVQQYEEEINLLNAQYAAGKYSTTEYMDRLADLMSAQRDAAEATESAKDAMMSLNKARVDIVVDGINEEIKAYKELIDAQIEALDAEKD